MSIPETSFATTRSVCSKILTVSSLRSRCIEGSCQWFSWCTEEKAALEQHQAFLPNYHVSCRLPSAPKYSLTPLQPTRCLLKSCCPSTHWKLAWTLSRQRQKWPVWNMTSLHYIQHTDVAVATACTPLQMYTCLHKLHGQVLRTTYSLYHVIHPKQFLLIRSQHHMHPTPISFRAIAFPSSGMRSILVSVAAHNRYVAGAYQYPWKLKDSSTFWWVSLFLCKWNASCTKNVQQACNALRLCVELLSALCSAAMYVHLKSWPTHALGTNFTPMFSSLSNKSYQSPYLRVLRKGGLCAPSHRTSHHIATSAATSALEKLTCPKFAYLC